LPWEEGGGRKMEEGGKWRMKENGGGRDISYYLSILFI